MGYDPTGNNKNDGNDQGGQRQNRSNYNQNSGGFNNKNNNSNNNSRGAPARGNQNSDKGKSSTIAAAWKRDDGSILVKFNGDEQNGIPAFDMFLNESKFADGDKKPDYVAFKTTEPMSKRT